METLKPVNGPPKSITEQLSYHRHTYYSLPRHINKVSPIEGNLVDIILQRIGSSNSDTQHAVEKRQENSHRAFQIMSFMIKALDLLAQQLARGHITRESYQNLKRPVLSALHQSLDSRTITAWQDPFAVLESDEKGAAVCCAMVSAADQLGREELQAWWEQCREKGEERHVVRNVVTHFIDGYAL